MSEYRTVSRSFWNDPYIESLNKEEKLIFAYLCTCSHINNLGVLEVSRNKIAFESGCSLEEVENALQRLSDDKKIIISNFYILVVNFIRNQTNNSPKVVIGLKGLFDKVRNEDIKRALQKTYSEIFGGYDEQEKQIEEWLKQEGNNGR